MSPSTYSDEFIKKPNVAGQFYSNNFEELSANIEAYFKAATVDPVDKKIDIMIVPHAGYIYSGEVAAYGFKAASQNSVKTVVILAASHHFGFDGVSVFAEGQFETPLGLIDIDQNVAKQLVLADENIKFEPRIFDQEHSVEVEIPFIQKTFQDAKIVPVLFGQPSFETVERFSAALFRVVGARDDVLIVVSTDLSHYHDDKTAEKMDSDIINEIKDLNTKKVWDLCQSRKLEMCGYVPVTAAMLFAEKKGSCDISILRYAHSGDVSGDNDRVVGYVSIIFSQDSSLKKKGLGVENQGLNKDQQKFLLDMARRTIEHYLNTGEVLSVSSDDKELLNQEGAFVTLHKKGQLRGCIGHIVGRGPLLNTIRDMAISSAAQDPRFSPVSLDELDELDLEISVLSVPRRVKNVNEIVIGKHGVIVRRGSTHQGVFLPQVADETGWSREVFLSQLCSQKAHLPHDAWKQSDTILEVFTAQVFSEHDK